MLNISTILSILAFMVAANLDDFGICIAYGVSGTRINHGVSLLVASISAGATALSIVAGGLFGKVFGEGPSHMIGVGIMLIIGGWLFLKSFSEGLVLPGQREIREVYKLYIKPLGLVVSILKEPLEADIDHSKTIDLREGLFLGAALAINCLASGVALGMIKLPVIATSLAVGLGSYLSTSMGCRIGHLAKNRWNTNRLGMWAGLILILMAFYQIW
ncbi:MAG TPA: manganese efflux pump [Bacillota bacterium]|nr:manganese efflux pump [Bacillota bacterium]